MRPQTVPWIAALALVAAGRGLVRAENVDLSTVPDPQYACS